MTNPPPKGQMYLFDSITPPLEDGNYRITASTDIAYDHGTPDFSRQYFFDIVGPRFTLPQAMVAGTFPPANSHGEYQNYLPHIVLSRRTLPWERVIAPAAQMPVPTQNEFGVPPPQGPVPWVALLVFEEGEYTFSRNVPLEQAVPQDVFQRLGHPANITCDALVAPLGLVKSIMPSVEELQLLAHARWVNVDDRELNTAGGDGFFSVVVANRLPQKAGQYRAFLVSLEERTDLVTADPPPVNSGTVSIGGIDETATVAKDRSLLARTTTAAPAVERIGAIDTSFTLLQTPTHTFTPPVEVLGNYPIFLVETSMVVLTSWKFTCEGPGPFRSLMQNLDDAMLGTVQDIGHPALSDTGHLQMTLKDRLGVDEQVLYRGPLVPWQLTRDNLGPYHSSDQCRRVTPETGSEDISYAAAFEVGRLLAAADPRLAQALMRWRRESYKQSARASTITEFNSRLPLNLPPTLSQQLHTPIAALASAAAINRIIESGPIIADAHNLTLVANEPGLQPAQLAQAWKLSSVSAAETLLNGTDGALGAAVPTQQQTERPDTSVGAVAADTAGLDRLNAARTQTINNAIVILEESR